ncbi:MAG: hypothetical protein JWP12_1386 [Bacteroidetes bacterium]|nr:hypothetical protein [Bacteroidota bacterium]
MYSRAEASQLKHEFWIAFGRYISLNLNSEGMKINWVNYHTGYKYVYFRMEVDQKKAEISIQLTHPDTLMRELYFDKFSSFRAIITNALNEDWIWEAETAGEYGKSISKIATGIKGVNVYDRNSWPEIISFFKPRIIALDEVWNDIKDGFEDLR